MFWAFAWMTSVTSNSNLGNFMTSGKVIKTPQKLAEGSFSVKLTTICKNNKGEILA